MSGLAKELSFHFEGGIVSLVEFINTKKTPLFPEVIQYHNDDGIYILDLAFQYNDGYSEQLFSFVNNIRTIEGGTHEAGFKSALTKASNMLSRSRQAWLLLKVNPLREQIGYVLQDTVLFRGTILENIAFAWSMRASGDCGCRPAGQCGRVYLRHAERLRHHGRRAWLELRQADSASASASRAS